MNKNKNIVSAEKLCIEYLGILKSVNNIEKNLKHNLLNVGTFYIYSHYLM